MKETEKKNTLFGCWIFHSFKSSIPISYAHAEEIRTRSFGCWIYSFIQIIITHIIFTCEGNQKKNPPFWMLDISFIQIIDTHIICTCRGNKKTFFWMLDISFIQINTTHIICTCKGKEIKTKKKTKYMRSKREVEPFYKLVLWHNLFF